MVLSETAQFLYKFGNFYDGSDELGIAWNDADLNISWGFAEPVLSEKDQNLPRLAEIPKHLLPVYVAR